MWSSSATGAAVGALSSANAQRRLPFLRSRAKMSIPLAMKTLLELAPNPAAGTYGTPTRVRHWVAPLSGSSAMTAPLRRSSRIC